MGFIKLLGAAVIVMTVASEVPTQNSGTPVDPDPGGAPPSQFSVAEVSIKLERTWCLGPCPVYSVEILGNGTVLYNGADNVLVQGSHTAYITEEQFLDLLNRFFRVRFRDLNSEYLSGEFVEPTEDGERLRVLHEVTKDIPGCILTLHIAGYEKRVSFQAPYAPRDLRDLAEYVDEAVESRRWIEGPAE